MKSSAHFVDKILAARWLITYCLFFCEVKRPGCGKKIIVLNQVDQKVLILL